MPLLSNEASRLAAKYDESSICFCSRVMSFINDE